MIKLSLNSIVPNSSRLIKKVLFDNAPLLSSDDKNFEFKVDTAQDHTLLIRIEDPSTQAKTDIEIPVRVKRDAIVGRLVAKPDSVGSDPFTVTLDASTTTVNDPTDEIVYFSWDF